MIGREQVRHDDPRPVRRRELQRMMIEIGVHEALERPLVFTHRIGEGRDGLPGCADILHAGLLQPQRAQIVPGGLDQIVDHEADLVTDQLAHKPVGRQIGMAYRHLMPAALDERHLQQLFQRENARPQAIVDIVIVISDIVRQRGNLSLQ